MDEAYEHIRFDGLETFSFTLIDGLQESLAARGVFLEYAPDRCSKPTDSVITAIKGKRVEPYSLFLASTIFAAGFSGFFASWVSARVTVGRYCSIASGVRVMGQNHPLDRVTSSSFTYRNNSAAQVVPYRVLGGAPRLVPFPEKPEPEIGHDVWIGQDVLLGRGIRIGTGAVIAAGAVVTKDVKPYAVVGGNPARHIKDRFPEKTIEALLRSAWWTYAFPHFNDLPFEDPERFVEALEARVARNEIAPYRPEKIDVYEHVMRFYGIVPADFDEDAYVARHPDVARAIANRHVASGCHHYVVRGRREGRVTGRDAA